MTMYNLRTKAVASQLCHTLCARGAAARIMQTSKGWLVLVIRGDA
jgi:hypothetical protein